ncbi:MAG: hypothetical protein J0H61_13220 [Alphaproteobacteria bacterium]|jgi:hypothetical protein|nr:hypothetical protein [Alphaproteobacteria bacterium]
MDRRQAYERNVLSSFARLAGRRAPGISDDEHDGEVRAQAIFYNALDHFRTKVADAAPLTELRRGALDDLLAGLADTTPDRRAWDEAIAEARRYG